MFKGLVIRMVATERTLVLVKPDGVQRALAGEILARVERKGYALIALKKMRAERALLEQHYQEHADKPFYNSLITFMGSGDLVAAIFEGEGVIVGFRSLAGQTDPTTASAGTIRGDYGRDWGFGAQHNLVHGSDSSAAAEREIGLWFPEPDGV